MVDQRHRDAAGQIAPWVAERVALSRRPLVVSIAGESGSGKSELAVALRDALSDAKVSALIIQQDDYFVHPPKTNDRRRREDIGRVGPGEVRLDLLDRNLRSIRKGEAAISMPVVSYEEDRIEMVEVEVGEAQVIVVEGTYSTLLEEVDLRIFIDRTYEDTRMDRHRRGRERPDPFIEQVLAIEHEIIAGHKARAHMLVGREYRVEAVAQPSTNHAATTDR